MTTPAVTGATPPGLARRFAAVLYDGALLFGVIFFAGFLYSVLTRQDHALHGRYGLMAVAYVLMPGLYFVGFWTRSGQTLAMTTWHLRVTDTRGQLLRWPRAALRYLFSWLWFLPALACFKLAGLQGGAALAGCLVAGIGGYLLVARLHPQRLFLHDVLSGSRVVTQLPLRS
ncbi:MULTISPECIES: RDD family protein [Roseateles]|uniref:RDD family membrane protein YckC n=1 Tax=Pelomonas aquatica TaxID=431058 RepID=A0ABU1ZAJ7_9BURK|nr:MULTISPECIES: RDD family protein [Roseateles]KQY88723.1 hypothetical protein ASD35_14385 [Pelomonas sp. Root1444]MDR7297650.1 putative RDD family membrane protein YckC [Pelomonas aquatica]